MWQKMDSSHLHFNVHWKGHMRAYWYSLFLKSWTGCYDMNAQDSLEKYGIATRYLYQPEEDFFDCYIPDTENEGYVYRMLISESDVEERFKTSNNMIEVCRQGGFTLLPFINSSMSTKLKIVCQYYDIFDFFGIEDELDSIPIEDVKLNKTKREDEFKVIPLSDQII